MSDHVLEHVDDYVHGVLDHAQAADVEAHVGRCRICQTALDEAEARKTALRSLPTLEASEPLIRQTLEHALAGAQRRRALKWNILRGCAAAAAVVAVLIGAANIYYARLAPSPYDLRILGQNELLAGAPASLRVAVIDRRTGRPVQGAPVEIQLRQADQAITLASYSTGDEGAAAFTLPDWKNAQCELRVIATVDGDSEELVEQVTLKRSWRLLLSCDKPIYQPGQVIRMRSLGLRQPDLKPVAGEKATFTIADPKGNVIFKQADVTSKFGIVSADCPLAAEIIEGAYRLECRVGSDTVSERTVEVRKYVLPKFRVSIATDKPFYGPGEQVTATVQADYFFGQPVAKGAVVLEARGRDAGDFKIAELNDATSETGKVEFKFRLPEQLVGREQDGGQARFELAASVTDSAGQSYAASRSRIVSANPIQIEVVAEDGALVQGVSNKVYIMTTYADGRPAKTRLVVHGADKEVETNDLGVAVIEVTPDSQGAVGLTIKATDAEGRIGRKAVTLAALVGAERDFLLRTDKAVYDAGETMTVTAIGGGAEPVFLDFLKGEQTMFTHTVDVAGGRGQTQVDLPAEMFGVVRLVAYRFGPGGLPVRKSRVIFIRQPGGLKIQASLSAKEYRPGERAQIQLSLTDADGKATPGAISLAAVDEAVFAVLNQTAGMERTFFLLEEELLKPVYTIYSNWSPEAYPQITAADRSEFEQALFSKTATGAGEGAGSGGDFFSGGEAVSGGVKPIDNLGGRPEFELSAWSLSATSYPAKVATAVQEREDGLAAVMVAWVLFAASLVLGCVIAFAILKPRAFLITAAVAACLCVLTTPVALLGLFFSARTEFKTGVPATREMMNDADSDFDAEMMPPMAAMEAMEFEEGSAHAAADDDTSGAAAPPAQPIRVRQWFPETLLWKPEVVTDEEGRATIDIELADSITQWRLSASAVSAGGKLGAGDFPIKVFQPFFVDLNLPAALTRNDQVGVPIVVYNYLDKPQTVTLKVEAADWFERTSGGNEPLTIELAAQEIRATSLPIRVLKVGKWKLQVAATSPGDGQPVADAIAREIEVVADGERHEQTIAGVLDPKAELAIAIPEDAIEGSVRAIVKLYPSAFSQLVEGLDAIFHMPNGCFEQTSSTTYPNVLALDYLKRTGKAAPQVEAQARQYVHLGYQRLLGFEVAGGGFDWYGNPPANVSLSAYGLMEFSDMAKVHDVDPAVIERTRNWILSQRLPDGSWAANDRSFHGLDALSGQRNLATTAYVAWAVFSSGASDQATATLDHLLAHEPATIDDPYVLSLVISAVAAIDPRHLAIGAYVDRLVGLKKGDADGKRVYWEQPTQARTMFYGAGQSGNVETTAMAALALLAVRQQPAATKGALTWLVEQKDARGTWHSTQATVLALKALLAGTGQPLGEEATRRITIALDGEPVETLEIPSDQAEVMQQIDLSSRFTAGERRLSVSESTGTGTTYQIAVWYHSPGQGEPGAGRGSPDPAHALSIDIAYDRQRLEVDQTVAATATVKSNMSESAPMVILDLPIPGGFVIERGELDELVGAVRVAKYEITPRQAIVYLREFPAGATLQLRYRLKATMPVKVSVPAGEVYEYYNPANRSRGGATELEAVET